MRSSDVLSLLSSVPFHMLALSSRCNRPSPPTAAPSPPATAPPTAPSSSARYRAPARPPTHSPGRGGSPVAALLANCQVRIWQLTSIRSISGQRQVEGWCRPFLRQVFGSERPQWRRVDVIAGLRPHQGRCRHDSQCREHERAIHRPPFSRHSGPSAANITREEATVQTRAVDQGRTRRLPRSCPIAIRQGIRNRT